jgi:hypothetical protein
MVSQVTIYDLLDRQYLESRDRVFGFGRVINQKSSKKMHRTGLVSLDTRAQQIKTVKSVTAS